MPLEEYRKKRDFTKTAEPSGGKAAKHAGLAYVIQKHAASHLHWDFRVELGGVMLSWAVPKGPSYDTAAKRLAMHVEDHPIEYGSFEGTIPAGEYGGGTVMLWDRGTWEPFEGDAEQAAKDVEKGVLKMVLHGERLKGRWVLVRTRGYGGGRDSWLLIKEHDGGERPHSEFDAIAEWTDSVSTGRTMEQIAEGAEVWHSRPATRRGGTGSAAAREVAAVVAAATGQADQPARARKSRAGSSAGGLGEKLASAKGARKARMPRELGVQLATLVKEVPEGDRWIHEVKYDGYRIIAHFDGKTVRLLSRNGKDWTERFPTITGAVYELGDTPVVLDGEVVVVRPDGTTDFQSLQNLAQHKYVPGGLHYQVFDMPWADGYDLRGVTLLKRKELLAEIVAPGSGETIRYSDHIEGRGDVFYRRACDIALEGIVSKRTDSVYESRRTRGWLKTKCLLRQEFVIVGWTDPGGARSGFGALLLGVYEDGKLRHAGRVGTGFSDASLAEIAAKLAPLATDTSPLVDAPTGPHAEGVHWVRPELVGEVAFAEWTAIHQLRHPSFQGLRDDKAASDVIAERPAPDLTHAEEAPAPRASATRSSAAKKGTRPVVAGIPLSHPERELWPEVPFTKLELAHYYEQVADFVLPHVVDRPLALVRCPSGHTGECFYQKAIANFPSAVKTVPIFVAEEGITKGYGRITDVSGLVGLVQMSVLEIHPWGSRTDDPERPDRIIFDLDPDRELPFATVSATAQLLRSELGRLGLEAWCKTTGGKGLHVVVPVQRRHTWDQVRDFSRAFVDSIVALEPNLFTGNMSKAKRGGRIFIDYLRNARGATAVAAYSTRARAHAPVSVPLTWEELAALTRVPGFSANDVIARVSAPGFTDPWSDIAHARQSISAAARKTLGYSG